MTATTDRHGAPADAKATRSPRRRGSSIALAGGVVAALLAGLWWHTHPNVFPGPGNSFEARPDDQTPMYVGVAYPPDGAATRVRVLDAEPRAEIFGEATAEVWACTGGTIGVVGEDSPEAAACVPLGEAAESWDQLVVRVAPEEPGAVVVLDGIDVTYSTGQQRGTQHTGKGGVIVYPAEAS